MLPDVSGKENDLFWSNDIGIPHTVSHSGPYKEMLFPLGPAQRDPQADNSQPTTASISSTTGKSLCQYLDYIESRLNSAIQQNRTWRLSVVNDSVVPSSILESRPVLVTLDGFYHKDQRWVFQWRSMLGTYKISVTIIGLVFLEHYGAYAIDNHVAISNMARLYWDAVEFAESS